MTILVVDDDADLREAVMDLLQGAGYTVIGASNGVEALEAMRSLRPDVVLLDLMLPILDGWKVHAEMKRQSELSAIPVIVLSAQAGFDELPAGTHGLRKPVPADRLLATVAQVLPSTT